MTTYMTQWMILGLIVVLGGTLAVDFVGSMLDGVTVGIVADLESLK